MFAAILVLTGIAGIAGNWLYRHYLRRPRRLQDVPVMLSGWADGQESMVAVRLRHPRR